MPVFELLTSSALGSLLGMRHALEPDHLAAVSTLVSARSAAACARRCSARAGVSATRFSLVLVGAVLVVLRAEMPARGRRSVRAVRRGHADRARPARHHGRGCGRGRPGRRTSTITATSCTGTTGAAPHVHVGRWTLARRPLLVGAVHGLAGSGALTALVLATLPSTAARHHLHGALRARIDGRHGGAVRPARLAARAARRATGRSRARCRSRSAASRSGSASSGAIRSPSGCSRTGLSAVSLHGHGPR